MTLPINMIKYFHICGVFAMMDLLSGEDFYSDNLDFKETGPVTPNFELIGSDNKIMMTNSGSYFVMNVIIFLEVLILFFISRTTQMCSRYKYARTLGISTYNTNPLASIRNSSLKLLLEGFFEVSLAVFINCVAFLEAANGEELLEYFTGGGNILNSTLEITFFLLLIAYLAFSHIIILKEFKNLDK